MKPSIDAKRIALPAAALRDGETTLRPWRDSDLSALVRACQDPEIARWTRVPANYSALDGRAYLLQRNELVSHGQAAPFAIISTATETLVGSIALMRIAWEHRRGEVGYWLGREGRGSGHATRAVRMICDWGAEALGLERIDLLAATENHRSRRVAQRSGFEPDAVLRSYVRGTHERQDMVVYGLITVAGAR